MRSLIINLLFFSILGCAVGPNFHHPASLKVTRYTEKMTLKNTSSAKVLFGKKQIFKMGEDLPLKWWTVFHSTELNQLIKDSIQSNPDIKAASATLKMAHENTLVQKAAFFPLVTANYIPSRQLTAGTLASNLVSNAYLYTLNTSSLNVSYMPDVFGFTRRTVESAAAQEESVAFQSEAIYLTLTSNVVLAAIQEASIRAQVNITKRSIKLARQFLFIMKQQEALGSISYDSVVAQEVLLNQTEALLPPLELQLAQQRDLISSLRGHLSSSRTPQTFTLDNFTLPSVLPVKLPSKLVEQRPDVRAAEAQMHAASALIGVAIANRLPNVFLMANGGFIPVNFSPRSLPSFLTLLPTGSSLFWDLIGNVAGTLFDAGALMHSEKKARAAYDLAEAMYRRVVLNAFQNVADSLKAIEFDAKSLKIASAQEHLAKKLFIITKHKLKLGFSNYLEVLNAEQSYQHALANLAQSQANRLTDTVALFQALGGGWSSCRP